MIGFVFGVITGISLVGSAINGQMYQSDGGPGQTALVALGLLGAGFIAAFILPNTVCGFGLSFSIGCLIAAPVTLFEGHPVWAPVMLLWAAAAFLVSRAGAARSMSPQDRAEREWARQAAERIKAETNRPPSSS